MNLILSNPSALNPLWLTILAEQLRTFGDFRTLDQHISSLSSSVASLLQITIKDPSIKWRQWENGEGYTMHIWNLEHIADLSLFAEYQVWLYLVV